MTYNIGELSHLKRTWLYYNSNIPQRFMGLEPADIIRDKGQFPEGIETWLDDVANGRIIRTVGGLGTTGVGLLLDGGPGLGKTTHAVTAAMEVVRRLPEDENGIRLVFGEEQNIHSRPIYYLTFPEFLSRKKAIFDASGDERSILNEQMAGLHGRSTDGNNVSILILDDLGKEYGSSYNDSSFDEVLRSRYDKALPTIITTNVARENWGKQYGEAMGSFAFEAFERIEIGGTDLRK
jgi:DNA replication protein DnaC